MRAGFPGIYTGERMNRTSIDWVRRIGNDGQISIDNDLGYTWNPITGCLNNCKFPCYARRLANTRLRDFYLEHRFVIAGKPEDPFAPRFWRNRLDKPQKIAKPSMVFVADMGDMWGSWVHEKTRTLIFNTIRKCPQHIFVFLTKCPQTYLLEEEKIPSNCWLGVSVCYRDHASNVKLLQKVKRTDLVKFISFEPLLEDVGGEVDFTGIDWVIIGAQTHPEVQPENRAVDWIVGQAGSYFIPMFMKDNLYWSVKPRKSYQLPFKYQDFPKPKK